VVIDFETASTRATPCQLAALRFRDGAEIDAMTTFIFQPPECFAGFNIGLHGITPRAVAEAPTWGEVLGRLLEFSEGAPLVAHNASFDLGVVRDACDLNGLEWPNLSYTCTISISRMVWQRLPSYSLPLLCSALKIPVDPNLSHDALYDSRLAGEVLNRAMAEKGVAGLPELLECTFVRFGELSPDGWFGSHLRLSTAAGIPQANVEADQDSPLYGKVVVFTGELAMVRREAWSLVAEAGGQPAGNMTKTTDILVCGYQDMIRLASGETKSGKLRRAEALHAGGQQLEILTERDFFRLLGSVE
jgi:DNA polymerase-3 subunit epsilon